MDYETTLFIKASYPSDKVVQKKMMTNILDMDIVTLLLTF